VIVGLAFGLGYVIPDPDAGGSGSGSLGVRPGGGGRAVASTALRNFGPRPLEIVRTSVEVPGAEVLDVRFITDEQADRIMFPSYAVDFDEESPDDQRADRPVVGPSDLVWIVVLFEPIDCGGALANVQANVAVTLRFSGPSFPPFTRTIDIDDNGDYWVDDACAMNESMD